MGRPPLLCARHAWVCFFKVSETGHAKASGFGHVGFHCFRRDFLVIMQESGTSSQVLTVITEKFSSKALLWYMMKQSHWAQAEKMMACLGATMLSAAVLAKCSFI